MDRDRTAQPRKNGLYSDSQVSKYWVAENFLSEKTFLKWNPTFLQSKFATVDLGGPLKQRTVYKGEKMSILDRSIGISQGLMVD